REVVSVHGIVNGRGLLLPSCQRVAVATAVVSPARALSAEMNTTAGIGGFGPPGCGCGPPGFESGGGAAGKRGGGLGSAPPPPEAFRPSFLEQPIAATTNIPTTPSANGNLALMHASSDPSWLDQSVTAVALTCWLETPRTRTGSQQSSRPLKETRAHAHMAS